GEYVGGVVVAVGEHGAEQGAEAVAVDAGERVRGGPVHGPHDDIAFHRHARIAQQGGQHLAGLDVGIGDGAIDIVGIAAGGDLAVQTQDVAAVVVHASHAELRLDVGGTGGDAVVDDVAV